MQNLIEFKVTRTLFDDVKADPEFRIGFEAEFHVRNASDLLRDQYGDLPDDFETYSTYYDYQPGQVAGQQGYGNIARTQNEMFHEDSTLYRLCQLFEQHLGMQQGSITIEDSGYTRWKLMVDPSLYDKPNLLHNPDDDIGVELISPIMPLQEGLAWMAKVLGMISSFRYQDISLYTTATCSFHVNLSHIRMGTNFDVAKLAILSGDTHYLQEFDRVRNTYAAPLMRAVYDQLVTAKEHPEKIDQRAAGALNLLRLRNWTPQRVMQDLASLIPVGHYFSVDLNKLNTNNPYIEVRIAGNAGYEQRFDEIAQLTIRFGALIKIACDPYAYREEYLKKVYQLVAGVIAQPAQPQAASGQQPQQEASPFPRLRLYLTPIMSTATRRSLDLLETYWRQQTLSVPNGSYLALAIIRSAFDLRQENTARVRQGLNMLIRSVLKVAPLDLLKSLRNNALLQHYGVLRANEKPLQIVTMLTNYLKGLNVPLAPAPQVNA